MDDLVERLEDGLWLLIKRDLYERPDHKGYTGIRDNAGRYSKAEADDHAAHHGADHVVRQEDAPEFRAAAFPDLVQAHLIRQREEALATISRLQEERTRLIIKHAEEVIQRALDKRSFEARIKELEAALRSIAEGNLGDSPWQASYARVKEHAVAALRPQGGA